MLPAELFLEEQSAPQHGGHAVGGDDGRGQGHVLRVGQGVDIGELARRFAQRAHVLRAFPLGDEAALFDEHHVDEADDGRQQERQLIGAVGAVLVQRLQHAAVGKRAQRVQQTVDDGQHQGQGGLGVAVVAGLLAGGAEVVVLAGLHDAQADDAHAHQGRGHELGGHKLTQAAGGQGQHGHQRAGGVADGGGDGQLDVPKADVADGHGADVQQGHGEVGQEDAAADLRAVDEDLIGGVKAHDHTNGHDHFQMTVFIVRILTADLAEQVRAAPADEGDERKPKPHNDSFISLHKI